jgi:hypothetical protein
MELLYHSAVGEHRRDACRVALVNLLGWLGWHQAREVCNLQWQDVNTMELDAASMYDLPPGVSTVLFKLLALSKSDITSRGTPWMFHYYQHQYLHPFMNLERIQGGPTLTCYDGSPGISYHRGAKTHCSCRCDTNRRATTTPKVSQHARW